MQIKNTMKYPYRPPGGLEVKMTLAVPTAVKNKTKIG